MSNVLLNIWKMVLGCVVGGFLISLNSCSGGETAGVKIVPVMVSPGAKINLATIPAGTTLQVRAVGHINSGQNQVGDTFLLSLTQPIMVDGRTLVGEGCEVIGRVVQVADAGKVKGRAELAFTLAQLNPEKHSYALVTDNFYLQAPSTKKRDAATIGGAAGVGAVIGGIIGGKKGVIIGGSAGGAAGTGVVLSNAGEEIDIPSGAIFHFVLGQSIEIEMTH